MNRAGRESSEWNGFRFSRTLVNIRQCIGAWPDLLQADVNPYKWNANADLMAQELIVQLLTATYAVCNAARLLIYVPQIVAIARERSGAHAISMFSWVFWSFSHAVTAVYCHIVVNDPLLSSMMWGNAFGCLAVVVLTAAKRRRYGWSCERPCT